MIEPERRERLERCYESIEFFQNLAEDVLEAPGTTSCEQVAKRIAHLEHRMDLETELAIQISTEGGTPPKE